MKPVTGRPVKVTAPAVTAPATGASLPRETRCEVAVAPRPLVEPMPVKARLAQPFWKPETIDTLVRLREPSTIDAVVSVGMWVAPGLRIDRTVDSQHRELAGPAGGSGEKSEPEAVAPRSSRLKNWKLITSHAPPEVSTLVYGWA